MIPSNDNRQFRLELVIDNLSFPTSITFDNEGSIYIAESGLTFDVFSSAANSDGGRIWKVVFGKRSEKSHSLLLTQGLGSPVNGLTFHNGCLYISEGGRPGRITRLDMNGEKTIILDNLPSLGNYHTNMVTFGPDDKLYFSQGAMTNSGIIGLDAYELGWLRHLPHSHDIPGYDIVLTGVNIETPNPISKVHQTVRTGAFVPFGTCTKPAQRIVGQLPCTAGIMRCNNDGSHLELVAWGLRNSYGLGFLSDGRLLAVDQSPDDRGSRPIGNAPDMLYEIHKGSWYGWPDFIGGVPITDTQYKPENGQTQTFVLANHDELSSPELPLLRFPPHSAAVKFDIVAEKRHNLNGQILVALFGDEKPMTAPAGPPAGRAVVRVDPVDWTLYPIITEPLFRPIDVRFNRVDGNIYILDFGQFEIAAEKRIIANAKSGKLWKLTCT